MKKNRTFAAVLLAATVAIVPLSACKKIAELPLEPPPTEEEPAGDDVTVVLPEEAPSESETPEEEPEQETVVVQKKATYLRCQGDAVNIRAEPSTSATVLGSAERDTVYEVKAKQGAWYEITYRSQRAYLSARYGILFELNKSENEQIEAVLSEGYKLLGTPYVYGAVRYHDGKGNRLKGFTLKKFDCSSLTQYVFYTGAGVLLDTTTRTQIKQGVYVSPSDLRRGDCIYFTNETRQYLTGIERVGHVAIYLGNEYVLHTASDFARIEKLTAKRWSFYIEARRFL